ncbi:MAG: ABC transporter ATP-binding protein [Candidatus Dormibacteraeota bacterium]|uniref:ABC transporter ATP-binding protein n=2 Tax=Candidatus Aeolococcus gillhamiae TaxID=3127015 RepID=A0A934JUI8_9BACT|nr:ABC transporter ATP-binding protein [Candidatus Dormibacteraeota bacterium]
MPVITARGLVKRYGDVVAVDDISFEVETGEVFGMLGPNGAGKTTTMEMLEGLRIPDSGSATVLGSDVVLQARTIKARIGVQLQATALPEYTKVREAIDLFGALYPTARPTADLIKEFDLEEKADAYASDLSGGQMQRLSIALALVNDPDVVFLDEPTTGLDPQARLNIWDVIEGIRSRGKTVVLTSHYMEEAERLCSRIAVIDHGRIVALDTPQNLITAHAPGTTIEFDAPHGVDEAALAALVGVESVAVDGRVAVSTRAPERVLRELLNPDGHWLLRGDQDTAAGIRDLRVRQGTLEDVFIALTGRSLRT